METNFNKFNKMNEYKTPVGYGENINPIDKIEGDDYYLTHISKIKTTLGKIHSLYNWILGGKIDFVYFVRILNVMYNLELNFNQVLFDSDDKVIKKIKNLWWIVENTKRLTLTEFIKKIDKLKYESHK